MNPECLTPGLPGNNQLLYFTSPSLLDDDERLVYLSDRQGHPNLFLRHLASGAERQLTFNTNGSLWSYVYFDGNDRRGLGKASVSVDGGRGRIYYMQDNRVCVVDDGGQARILARLPDGQITAFTHVSQDGRRLCVPTADARVLEGFQRSPGGGQYDVDERVRREGLSSYLHVFDTENDNELCCEKVSRAWITHVQFSPLDAGTILYNHEWTTAEPGFRRMWIWDGCEHRPLRGGGEARSAQDWVCHEMWTRDGRAIIYHGRQVQGRSFIGRVNADGSEAVEISLPAGWNRYGHFTAGPDGLLTTDGYYETPDDPPLPRSGQWITVLRADWTTKLLTWMPLCRHGSNWESQDCHPHPVFDHRGDAVLFTSNQEGLRAVYRVSSSGIPA